MDRTIGWVICLCGHVAIGLLILINSAEVSTERETVSVYFFQIWSTETRQKHKLKKHSHAKAKHEKDNWGKYCISLSNKLVLWLWQTPATSSTPELLYQSCQENTVKLSPFPLAVCVQSENYYLQHLNSMAASCMVTVPVLSNAAASSHQSSQVLPRKQCTGCIMKYTVDAVETQDLLYTHCESLWISHAQWLISR